MDHMRCWGLDLGISKKLVKNPHLEWVDRTHAPVVENNRLEMEQPTQRWWSRPHGGGERAHTEVCEREAPTREREKFCVYIFIFRTFS